MESFDMNITTPSSVEVISYYTNPLCDDIDVDVGVAEILPPLKIHKVEFESSISKEINAVVVPAKFVTDSK